MPEHNHDSIKHYYRHEHDGPTDHDHNDDGDGLAYYEQLAAAEFDEYQHDRTARYHKHRTPNHHHHAAAEHFHDFYGDASGWDHHDHDTGAHSPVKGSYTPERWAAEQAEGS